MTGGLAATPWLAAAILALLVPQAPMLETAAITGVVVDDASGHPMPWVVVAIEDSQGRTQRTVVTGEDGAFEVTRLVSGRYRVRAQHPGYGRPPWRPGHPPHGVVLSAGGRVQSLVVRLRRLGAIEGTVTDEFGRVPLDVQVTLFRCRDMPAPCERVSGPAWPVDHRGRYRAFGLEDGTYIVSADARLVSDTTPVLQTEPRHVAWAEAVLAGGQAPMPSAPSRTGSVPPVALLTTFASTAVSLADAQRVVIAAGRVAEGVDIRMQSGAAATISGRVESPSGVARVTDLTLIRDEFSALVGGRILRVSVSEDGRFMTPALPPGAWRLLAHWNAENTVWLAEHRVEVAGQDTANVVLAPHNLATLEGRLVVADAEEEAALLSGTHVVLRRTDVGGMAPRFDRFEVPVGSDGRFIATTLLPGHYRVSLSTAGGAGSPLWIEGDDTLDLTTASAATTITIAVATRPSAVSGTVLSHDGHPMPEYLVVAFPENPGLRHEARRVRAAVVAHDGSYWIDGLPEGRYLVAVLGTDDPSEVTTGMLALLEPYAQSAEVIPRQVTEMTLRVAGR